jgi:long-chain acyl-CoA synthetase
MSCSDIIKDEEATRETVDSQGWYHTGDLGLLDKKGNLFIKGRIKNMILGPSGQNIYPEEIEDLINSMLMVSESVVVQRQGKLVALVYPDYEDAHSLGLTDEHVTNIMELNRVDINEIVPAYERISSFEIVNQEFEKTPKKSIKRYLYK